MNEANNKTDILNYQNFQIFMHHDTKTVSVLLMMNDVLAEDEYDGTGDFPSIL